jgi:uncharacterized membrane protein YkvA (DUF1232 family)
MNNYENYEYEKHRKKTEEYINDREKTRNLLEQATKKAKKQGPLDKIWDDIQLMFGLLGDWLSGTYKVSTGTILAILGAVIYFVTPIDAIPDFIPVLGWMDDAAVFTLVINQIRAELDRYKAWKR